MGRRDPYARGLNGADWKRTRKRGGFTMRLGLPKRPMQGSDARRIGRLNATSAERGAMRRLTLSSATLSQKPAL